MKPENEGQTTRLMSFTSMPRAATSVATKVRHSPFVKSSVGDPFRPAAPPLEAVSAYFSMLFSSWQAEDLEKTWKTYENIEKNMKKS